MIASLSKIKHRPILSPHEVEDGRYPASNNQFIPEPQ